MLAKVSGIFRLTRDAELKNTSSGMAIVKVGLACSEKYKDKETTLFIDATCFGKQAEVLNQYAGTKGTQIYIVGKLQTEQWQSKEGINKSKIAMMIEGFEFIGSKAAKTEKPEIKHEQIQKPAADTDIDEDEIPF